MPDEQEIGIAGQMSQIALVPGDEIVHPNDFVTIIEKAFAQMRAQKTCCSSD
jgi:hypothetical protein